MKLPTKSASFIQSSYGNFHFDNLTTLKWNSCLDTTTTAGGWSMGASDVNGDYYVNVGVIDYMKYKSFSDFTTGNIFKTFPMKLSNIDGSPIFQYKDLTTSLPKNSTNYALFQNFLIDNQGNLILSGNLSNNKVIVGTDTAKYYGGNNDMFVMRYGNPCSNTTPLIAAGTPSGLLAKCNGTSLKASWQLLNNNEDKYYIYRSLSASGPFVKYDSVIPPTTTYIDAAVVSKTNYWYAISSHNIVGEGYLSIADSARLCDDTLNGMANVNTSQIAGQLYPNPTTDEVNLLVQTTEINATAQLQITNYIGQLLLDKTVILKSYNNFKIDVANYAGGIYLVTLKTPQSRYSEKLIVVK